MKRIGVVLLLCVIFVGCGVNMADNDVATKEEDVASKNDELKKPINLMWSDLYSWTDKLVFVSPRLPPHETYTLERIQDERIGYYNQDLQEEEILVNGKKSIMKLDKESVRLEIDYGNEKMFVFYKEGELFPYLEYNNKLYFFDDFIKA